MLLTNSEYAGEGDADLAESIALEGSGEDPKGQRAEFRGLVGTWSARR